MEQRQRAGINKSLVLVGLILGMFFGALEQTIVGTAMPTILSELQGFEIFVGDDGLYDHVDGRRREVAGRLRRHLRPQLRDRAVHRLLFKNRVFAVTNGLRFLLGLGMGLVMPTLMIAVQSEFPQERLGQVTAECLSLVPIGARRCKHCTSVLPE